MTGHWLMIGYAALGGLGVLVFLRIIANEVTVRERVLLRAEKVLADAERKMVAEVASSNEPAARPEGQRYTIPPMPPPKRRSSRG